MPGNEISWEAPEESDKKDSAGNGSSPSDRDTLGG